MNWSDWHKDYDQVPSLQARLKLVGEQIAGSLDEFPPGPLQIVSICSGDGRDVISALQDHPRRNEVTVTLLDHDAESIARGRATANEAGLGQQLRFIQADATLARNYLGATPADLVLLSGFLGHLPHQDVPRLIENLPMLCKKGGCVIWNRHLLIHQGREQVPAIREFFRKSSFAEVHYTTTGTDGFAVGRVRFDGQVLPLDPNRVFFEFVGLDRLLPPLPARQNQRPPPQNFFADGVNDDEMSLAAEQSIPERFEKIAALYPDRTALGSNEWQPDYTELNALANRLAHILMARGAVADRVALLMRQDGPLIAAILAVLKAGRIVVVLNPTDPAERLKQILEEADARLIVTDVPNRELASQLAAKDREVLLFAENTTGAAHNPEIQIAPDAVAFIIFTSGSTGRPKGVMQTHRNILHNVFRLSRGMKLRAEDRISLLASPSGGQGLSTMWCALLNGASLCPFSLMEKSAANLAPWIEAHGITILILTASLFRHFMKSIAAETQVPTVRLVRVASEPATTEDFTAFKEHFADGCVLMNSLSSSETGNITQQHFTRADHLPPGRLPVGRPAAGMQVLLLDENNQEVSAGETGEIIVRSRYLSPGYWRNEPLTTERFTKGSNGAGIGLFRSGDLGRHLPDGSLLFMGRKDTCVKIHGYRIELSEIEDLLAQQPEVERVLVSVHKTPTAEDQLIAHIVPASGKTGSVENLRRVLRQNLPGYMVPAHFIFLDQFPLTPHGKINREALPPPSENKKRARRSDRPRDLIEARLTKIWQSALGLPEIRRHDDFFDLGGTSLQSADVLLGIEESFGISLPPSILAEHSTVERLAAVIAGQILTPSPSPLVPLRAAKNGRPLFLIHTGQGEVTTYIPLARRLSERPIYGLQSGGLSGECWPLASVQAMAKIYLPEILAKDPDGPYLLAATCMGGLVAFELAQMLLQRGKQVGLLALIDTHFPLSLAEREQGWRKIYIGVRTPLHEIWRALRWKIIRAFGGAKSSSWLPGYRAFVAHQNGHAARAYRPVFYPGELVLFYTTETQIPYREDPRLRMRPLAQTARVVELPGKRSGLFMKPGVDELARQLQAALETAEETSPESSFAIR
jgi:amino acid adenylation domain-containing protein